jgi:hypothetical protein
VEAVILTLGIGHILPMDCIAFEAGEDRGDVILSFSYGGDGSSWPHAAGACVIGGQSKVVAAEFCEVCIEDPSAAIQVLLDVPNVGDAFDFAVSGMSWVRPAAPLMLRARGL